MAIDFSVLERVPTIGQRIREADIDIRREAEQNMLRQQRAMQVQQAQEDRERALERQRRQDAVYKQAADVLRQYGKNPDDPQVLQEGAAAAMEAGNTQMAQVFSGMLADAQKRAQEKAYRAEYEQKYGGGAAAGTAAAPAAAPAGAPLVSPKVTSTLIDQGARQPDVAPPAITAAQAFPVAPLAGMPTETPMAATTNALAAAPAARGANALAMPADPFAAQRAEAMKKAMSLNPFIAAEGKLQLENIPKLQMPKTGAGQPTPSELQIMDALNIPRTEENYRKFKSYGMREPAEQAPILTEVQDPQNPQRMLKVDTRVYRRGGGIDSPGVIGVAKQAAGMTPAQETKRRETLGKEFKQNSAILQGFQDVLDSTRMVKESPGLSRATGYMGTMLPSFPEGEAALAETRLTNLEGKVTLLGKTAASASGALGNMAVQEWRTVRDMVAAIDPKKGTRPLIEQIDLVEAFAQGAMEKLRDAYQRTYGEDFERFPQFADLPAPKSVLKPKASATQPATTPAPGSSIREQADAILGGGR